MKRQVRAIEEQVACDVCGRTMLKGERTEPYLAPSRERKLVCSLCAPRAQQEGWIRESANPATPVQPPREPERRRRLRRGRRARAAEDSGRSQVDDAPSNGEEAEPVWPDTEERPPPPRQERQPRLRRDPRHVRAVPTNAQLKLERALELFNTSEHLRTVTGLARTLGTPQVSASTSGESAAEVVITVAWDISWYQFVVDLSDYNQPVRMETQGQEIEELAEEARNWNTRVEPNGSLAIGSGEGLNGEEPEQVL
jgi:hypothetical protein